MKTRRFQDPRAFQEATEAYLLRDEARHNLLLGLMSTLKDRPEVYPAYGLWSVEDEGEVVGAALITPPFNLVVAAPEADGALACLAATLCAEAVPVPGVVAALPEVDHFLAAYAPMAEVAARSRQEQAIHVLGTLASVEQPPGEARPAGPDDTDLVLTWSKAFHEEAGSTTPWDEDQARRNLKHKIPDGSAGGMRIWEDDGPVCLVGFVDATPTATRVGPVYTPPAHRRRGYGTALTAHVTGELVERGRRLCLLYTDLANPTSNAIYHRIGYRVVCKSAMVSLGEAS